jgi:RHS repeat-associated protein
MTHAWHLEQHDSALNWQAGLRLGFVRSGARTQLAHTSHRGPLRVQRPFTPEGLDCPHLYILHPPGGLVSGDNLRLQADMQENACAVLTTPSSGKFYRARDNGTLQVQHNRFTLLDRLTAEQRADRQQTYTYDAVGNRTGKTITPLVDGEAQASIQKSYQYASNSNRITEIDAQAITADAVGNLTQDRANRELVYDAQSRLTSVKIAGSPVAEFRYNALGQRTQKRNSQGITTFLYGPDGQLLGEQQFDSQGSKLSGQYYIWLERMPVGGVSITFDSQGAIATSEPFYLHSDHLNTPRMATDQAHQNVWQWQSDAFGVGQATGSLVVNLRFPGQYFDQESGLHYNYFRDYDPETGRYVESDPIGLNGGLNTYGYVLANPLLYTDRNGLAVDKVLGGAALGAYFCLKNKKCQELVVEQCKKVFSRKGPSPNDGNAKPHGNNNHNDAIDNRIDDLKKDPSVTDIRKNQQQVDVDGNKVGTNRPDVQYNKDGCHHCVEYDNVPKNSTRRFSR